MQTKEVNQKLPLLRARYSKAALAIEARRAKFRLDMQKLREDEKADVAKLMAERDACQQEINTLEIARSQLIQGHRQRDAVMQRWGKTSDVVAAIKEAEGGKLSAKAGVEALERKLIALRAIGEQEGAHRAMFGGRRRPNDVTAKKIEEAEARLATQRGLLIVFGKKRAEQQQILDNAREEISKFECEVGGAA